MQGQINTLFLLHKKTTNHLHREGGILRHNAVLSTWPKCSVVQKKFAAIN